jgi:phenylalanyl-tRNA synthetase beta chain
VARGAVDVYPKAVAPRVIDLRAERARALLGLDVPLDEMAKTLRSLELAVEKRSDAVLRVTAPTFRPDLEREVDLIDEVGRMRLAELPATLPQTRVGPAPSGDPVSEGVRDALAAAGLCEAITFGFTSVPRIAALRLPEGHPVTRPIAVQKPLRDEHTVMRTSLLPNLLSALAHNLKFGVEDVRLFEVGHVFLRSDKELPNEPRHAAGVLAGSRGGWLQPAGPLDFYDAKGVIERLFAALRIAIDFVPARAEDGFLHPGVAAAIMCGDRNIGVVGEVHPETRDRFGIERVCFAFDLSLDLLPPLQPTIARAVDRFPAIVRDVSFFVDESTPAATVRDAILELHPACLESVRVLDDYREPGKVPQGKKGMLWSMTYRAPDRTLTDKEVDAAHEAMVEKLLARLRASRR